MLDYPLDPAKPLDDEVRSAAAALLGDAAASLRRPPEGGTEAAVHEARRRLKEVRALLRLVDKSIDAPKHARGRLKDAADLLADARDASAAVEALDELLGENAESELRAVRDELVRRRDAELSARAAQPMEEAAALIDSVRAQTSEWTLGRDGWAAVRPGLKKLYKRGRDAYAAALVSGGEADAWHELRLRGKELRHALEFLHKAAPDVMKGACDAARALTRVAGRDHDLAELSRRVGELQEGDTATAAIEEIRQRCEAKRAETQREAARLGAILYAEKPGAFARRIGAYWESAWGR